MPLPFFKRVSLGFLLAYAAFYPLLTHIFMANVDEGAGAPLIQLFQALAVLATLSLWRFKEFNLREGFDVWSLGIFFFSLSSLYFAFFLDCPEPFQEIMYAGRFLAWFLFAICVSRDGIPYPYLKRLIHCFWFGAFIQCFLAILTYATRGSDSMYSNVHASVGSINVSGKTIVSFVVLNSFLSFYWYLVHKKPRALFLFAVVLGTIVLLISYNRANQLAVALSFLCVVVKLLRRERMKAVAICVLLLSLAVAFFGSSLGESFLVRWNEVRDDQGSGRATLILASWNHFLNPESLRHFLIGSGHYSMKELMYEACGARIGAHSDLFDFLTVYGFCGVVIYFAVCFRLLFTGRDRLTRDSLEDIVLRSSTVFVLLVGLFTGVFQATYTLFMLITLQRYLIERGLVGEERAPIAIWSTSTRSFRETLALNEERFEDDLAKESDKNSGSDSLAIFEEAIATFDFEEIEESEKKVRQQRIEAIDDFWKRTQGGDQ